LTAQAVVWDLDGTLLDSFDLQKTVLSKIFTSHAMPIPSEDEFVHNYHGRLIDSIRNLTGLEGTALDEIYREFIAAEEEHYEHPTALYFTDALDLLNRTHDQGMKQIIISNRPHYNDQRLGSPRNLASRPPLAGKIETVVCGDDSAFHKPDARTLDAAEHALGLTRSALLVIGDQFVDVELAHNLGAHTVLVNRSGEDIPYAERLPNNWQESVTIVRSLRDLTISHV
jgi:phosphoglycolate phosphatase-like HAD superfamily hydrolase